MSARRAGQLLGRFALIGVGSYVAGLALGAVLFERYQARLP